MSSTRIRGQVLSESGLVPAELHFGARIRAVEPVSGACSQDLVVPGFIDLHLHGGGGGDVMAGEEGIRRTCRFHLRQGTTSVLPTTMTAPLERLEAALLGIQAVIERPEPGGAAVLGAHLEGPFISSERLGAQPPYARAPEPWEVQRLLELTRVRVLTCAPELDGSEALLRLLVESGVRAQIGHTSADYQTCRGFLRQGGVGFTHLFNAMAPMHHRDPGPVAAALAHAQFAEIIADGSHVVAGALRAALRAIPQLYCVSDAVPCAGMPDGEYELGRHPVHLCCGRVALSDGTLAGSGTALHGALRVLVDAGDSPADAARRLSSVPAAYLGLGDRGRLAPGTRADIVVMDPDLNVRQVFLQGRPIEVEEEGEVR